MIPFSRYPKISSKDRFADKEEILSLIPKDMTWYCTEKIRGMHMALYTNGNSVWVASRSGFLTEHNTPLDYSEIIKEHEEQLKAFSLRIQKPVILYGEFFGGWYAGEDHGAVNRDIEYCPHTSFTCYDIKVGGAFLDFKDVVFYCNYMDIMTPPILRMGSYSYCSQAQVFRTSEVSDMFEYLEIPMGQNLMEGLILRPDVTYFTGDDRRVMFKDKNWRFQEFNPANKVDKEVQETMDEHIREAVNGLYIYATENRIKSVISHMGGVFRDDAGRVTGLLTQDIFFDAEVPAYESLAKADQRVVHKLLGRLVKPLVTDYFSELFPEKETLSLSSISA